MRLEISMGGKKREATLGDGGGSIGGGERDQVKVPGAPEGLVEVRFDGQLAQIRTRLSAQMNGVPFPALVSRVWVAGETLSFNGLSIVYLADNVPVQPGTAAVAKELLSTSEINAASSLATFVCLTGSDSGRRIPVLEESLIIGRGERSHILIRDASVSRQHARLLRKNGVFELEDLQSPNGVFVDGLRVKGARALKDGSVIEIGQTLLRFQLPARAAAIAEQHVLEAKEPLLPKAAEPPPKPFQKKLSLVAPPPPPPDALDDGLEACEPPRLSTVQPIRMSAVARRAGRPDFKGMTTREWALIAGGAMTMLAGALAVFAALG